MKNVSLIDENSDGSTNIELENKANKLKLHNFRGVFMVDELSKLTPLNNECGIINLETSNKNGSHWVCWWRNENDKYYFDSFGINPDKRVIKYLKSPILYSTYQIQQYNDTNCGLWCLFVLNKLNQGEDFIDIILNILNKYKLY